MKKKLSKSEFMHKVVNDLYEKKRKQKRDVALEHIIENTNNINRRNRK